MEAGYNAVEGATREGSGQAKGRLAAGEYIISY